MKVAFVVHQYGEEVCGGAEFLCRQVAERMLRHWDVEILTTCAVDADTWANTYPPGVTVVQGVDVRRFPVDHPRDLQRMGELNARVYSGTGSSQDEIDWIVAYGPYSTELHQFLRSRAADYDFVIFFTYVYALTVFGVPLVRDRCALVPTAHDEPEIYIPIFRRVFRGVRALLFLSSAEQRFVNRLFGTGEVVQDVVGVGIERADGNSERFRKAHATELGGSAILLYAGRINERKGVGTLLSYFARFCEQMHEDSVKLVLIGTKAMDIPEHRHIVNLGYVSEQKKFDAIDAASVVVQPSLYESLSIVALEAWQAGKPVLVNGECDVLRDQCVRSNAGLWYENYEEFRDELAMLLEDEALRKRLGRSGRDFVERHYSWDVVESKYLSVVARAMEMSAPPACSCSDPEGSKERWIGRDLMARLQAIRGRLRSE